LAVEQMHKPQMVTPSKVAVVVVDGTAEAREKLLAVVEAEDRDMWAE
jgi:hypothetical protein